VPISFSLFFNRFADILGLDLSEVKTFSDEIPRIPRAAFDDLDMNIYDYETGSTISKLSFLPSTTTAVPTTFLVPMFSQPSGEPHFLETVRVRKVCLDTAFMDGPSLVVGVVQVLNISYHKSVTVKWTVNDWTTVTDTSCKYMQCNSKSNSDSFIFKLVVGSLSEGSRVQFCLKYYCEGEHWDNNGGENYVFQVRYCFRNWGQNTLFSYFKVFLNANSDDKNEVIDKEVARAKEVSEGNIRDHLNIETLLRGLNYLTEMALAPLENILQDSRLDTNINKDKYEEKVEQCYGNASILAKLVGFLDQIQVKTGKTPVIEELAPKIMALLIDINPEIAGIATKGDAVRKIWKNEQELTLFLQKAVYPILRERIKNLIYEETGHGSPNNIVHLEPSAEANYFRLNMYEDRIAALESQVVKVDIVAKTLAREVANIKQAKASAAFEREEKKLKLKQKKSHQNKDYWK
jgi:hypothetical protein